MCSVENSVQVHVLKILHIEPSIKQFTSKVDRKCIQASARTVEQYFNEAVRLINVLLKIQFDNVRSTVSYCILLQILSQVETIIGYPTYPQYIKWNAHWRVEKICDKYEACLHRTWFLIILEEFDTTAKQLKVSIILTKRIIDMHFKKLKKKLFLKNTFYNMSNSDISFLELI